MFFPLVLIFIVIPVVELWVLIRVGEVLGTWSTVALVLLTAVVGVSLVRSQGVSTLMAAQEKLSRGEAPTGELVEGIMLAMAGVLLLIPGFVTDFIGLLLLSPFTRKPLAKLAFKRMQLKVVNGAGQGPFGQGPFGQGPFGQGPFGQDPFNHKPHGRDNYDGGNTFEGDFERTDERDARKRLDNQPFYSEDGDAERGDTGRGDAGRGPQGNDRQ
ncbi:FxsA family protein [Shewanella sp. JM162201]|uniref:FxsA family protein n=1 Tax=Shewanella jiangmenensis TaxID=2837387 RepID=A0ABS5V318_9GAMM|nr:FxsA family protein [Shewanella jiangmenensis]MBT1444212.1 FxsA family protein [Shewanella jiangmenensis]